MYKALLLVVLLCAVSCTRHEVPVVVAGQAPTTQLEQMGAVKMAPVVVTAVKPDIKPAKKALAPLAKKAVKHPAINKAEQAALAKAEMNDSRAACLRRIVDMKAKYDIAHGKINDWGNARDAEVCAEYRTDAQEAVKAVPKAKSKWKSSATKHAAKKPASKAHAHAAK